MYRSGKVLQKLGNGFMLGNWYFLKGGTQVAFHTDTVHGSLTSYYELHDIETDKIVDTWEGPVNEKSPEWAKRLERRE